MTINITGVDYSILSLLGRYKYLTAELLILAECTGKYSYIEKKRLPRLSEGIRPYILKKKRYKKNGEEHIYALSERGARYISEIESVNVETIHYVKGKEIKIGYTANHILKCAEFQTRFRRWLKGWNGSIEIYQTDLEKLKKKRERKSGFDLIPKNRIYIAKDKKIEPDAIIKYKIKENVYLLALEIEIDKNKQDIIEAIKNHMLSLNHAYISKKFDYNKSNHVLYVFDKKGQLENVKEEILKIKNFEKFRQFFIFNSIKQTQKEFCQGWHYANNIEVGIFKKS